MTQAIGQDWGVLVVGGTIIDADVSAAEVTRKTKWDKKTGAGVDGAYCVYQGDELADVSFTLQITSKEQLDSVKALILFLLGPLKPVGKTAPKGRAPQDWVHPALSVHGIRSLIVEEIKGPIFDEKQLGTLTIKAIEWRKPPKTSVTKAAVASDGLGKMGRDGKAAILGGLTIFGHPPPPSKTPYKLRALAGF